MNGDGHSDLLLSCWLDTKVGILPGHGDATFGAVASLTTSGGATKAKPADLNGDGRLDVVYGLVGSFPFIPGKIVKRIANGSGGFGAEQLVGNVSLPSDVAVGDLNGDAIPDIVASATVPTGIVVFLGLGMGRSARRRPSPISPRGAASRSATSTMTEPSTR